MFTTLKNLYSFVDQTVEKIYRQYPNEIQCKKTCADCCHAVFDVSFVEAAYLATFLHTHLDILTAQQTRAQQAANAFEKLAQKDADLATARIRCPFLGDDNLCMAHLVRPINCRTYGTPTVINGEAHVCGLSGFDNDRNYPTIDLAPLQKSLSQYSIELAGKEVGKRRFPISWVFLKMNYFLPPQPSKG